MKKIESGRSMIEMLGVLAIIGVLSIGGLAGYTMAMNRHRANTILDYASKCAVIAQTRGTGDTALTEANCASDEYMGTGTQPTYTNMANDGSAIKVKRLAQGDTTVTVTFSAVTGVTKALASRLELTDSPTYTFSVDHNCWNTGTTNTCS